MTEFLKMSDDEVKNLLVAEMQDYFDGAYADAGCARDQLTRLMRMVEAKLVEKNKPKEWVGLPVEAVSLGAHNIDPGDWNDIKFRGIWMDGFKAGASISTTESERIKVLENAAYALMAILDRVGPEATVADVLMILDLRKLEFETPLEPFGYVSEHNFDDPFSVQFHRTTTEIYLDNCKKVTAVYTKPIRHKWDGLSEDEMHQCFDISGNREDIYRSIEAKLREKNAFF